MCIYTFSRYSRRQRTVDWHRRPAPPGEKERNESRTLQEEQDGRRRREDIKGVENANGRREVKGHA